MPECFSSSLSFSSIATVKRIFVALALEGLPSRSGSRIWQVSRLVARPREWPPASTWQWCRLPASAWPHALSTDRVSPEVTVSLQARSLLEIATCVLLLSVGVSDTTVIIQYVVVVFFSMRSSALAFSGTCGYIARTSNEAPMSQIKAYLAVGEGPLARNTIPRLCAVFLFYNYEIHARHKR